MSSRILLISDNTISQDLINSLSKIVENVKTELFFTQLNSNENRSNQIIGYNDALSQSFDLIINSTLTKDIPIFIGFPPILNWELITIEEQLKSAIGNKTIQLITEQKQNRESILDSLEEAVMAHDLNRKVFYFSPKAEEITGYSQIEVIGRDCHDIFEYPICGNECQFCGTDEDTSDTSCVAPTSRKYMSILYTKDGFRKDVFASIIPLNHSNSTPFGTAIVLKNLTHEKELERRLATVNQFHRLKGSDASMQNLYESIAGVGTYDFPVLIEGDSGTGKELIADAIHKESQRRGLFVPVNCGAIPEGTLESELFGHVKGAFTGAIKDKKGRFELAEGGTIFLDEIGELPLSMQVKLLRVIQEGVVEPVGGESSKKLDIRIISATNKNLLKMVEDGTFREDLYYRLAVVPIKVPPLKDRNSDVIVLAREFLTEIGERFNHSNLKLDPETESIFLSYDWPGNVRQLLNVIQYAMIKCKGKTIEPIHLPPELLKTPINIRPITVPLTIPSVSDIYIIDDDIEVEDGKVGRKPVLNRNSIIQALIKAGGNKAKAARLLGVGRATLYNYIKKYPEIISEAGKVL